MAIYGDQLSFFPEQFRMFEYFKMKAKNVSSYSARESLGRVKGVFQFMKRGELERENETLADVEVPTFWTRVKLETGNFIHFDEVDYRIKNEQSWLFEGGFRCYVLETIIGNTDTQVPHPYVDLGQGSYD